MSFQTKLAETCRFHREMWIGPNVPESDDTFAIEQLDHGFRTLRTAAVQFGDHYLTEGRARYYERLLVDAAVDFPTAFRLHLQVHRGIENPTLSILDREEA